MKATRFVFGNEVGGPILQEEDKLLTQLGHDVLDWAKLSDPRTLFESALQISHNLMSSLTTPSAVIVLSPKLMTGLLKGWWL
jgi:hypothetical protein